MPRLLILLSLLLLPLSGLTEAVEGSAGAELPVTLVLSQTGLQRATADLLATQTLQGETNGRLYGGAVIYSVDWKIDRAKAALTLHALPNGVRVRLALPLGMTPDFELRNGADTIYSSQGCGRLAARVTVSLDIKLTKGLLSVAKAKPGLTIPRKYGCIYTRNFLGDVRNLFTNDTKKRVDVVPKMRSAINSKLAVVTAPLQQAVSARIGAAGLTAKLRQRLLKTLRVTENVHLQANFSQLLFDKLELQKQRLVLNARVRLQPRFKFGADALLTREPFAQAEEFSEGFRLPFDLLIPRTEEADEPALSAPIQQPAYRFAALPGRPGVAVLERFQGESNESVVWLQAGIAPPPPDRLVSMGAPIAGVLEEIVSWLTVNRGVRSAGGTPVDRLRDEVQRFATLVTHFQRPRDLPLPSIGSLRLSNLNADLLWLALEPDAIRAGVVLTGRAAVTLEF